MKTGNDGIPGSLAVATLCFLTRNPPLGLVTSVDPNVMFSFTSVTLGMEVLTENRRTSYEGGKQSDIIFSPKRSICFAQATARSSSRSTTQPSAGD